MKVDAQIRSLESGLNRLGVKKSLPQRHIAQTICDVVHGVGGLRLRLSRNLRIASRQLGLGERI